VEFDFFNIIMCFKFIGNRFQFVYFVMFFFTVCVLSDRAVGTCRIVVI